jgi:hypothetical protein
MVRGPKQLERSVQMIRWTALVLSSLSLTFATAADAPVAASTTNDPSVAAIKQLGHDMGDAMVAQDIEKIDRIFGNDWISARSSGSVSTKAMLVDDVKTGRKKLTWYELGPIDVQVFGETAIAQGNVAEKRVIDGKETYMELVYADILKMRNGRWVVVQSMGAKVK